MKIIESLMMVEQFRFPKSRKKRIRKKWSKRPENFRPDMKKVYQMGDAIVCHPKMAALIRSALENIASETRGPAATNAQNGQSPRCL